MFRTRRNLRSFLENLEDRGELRRVVKTVSPLLEIAEHAVQESQCEAPHPGANVRDREASRLGGQALLFENVEGCDFPLVINVFGSAARMDLALRCEEGGLKQLADRIDALAHLTPPSGVRDLVDRAQQVLPLLRAAPRSVRSALCQEVVCLSSREEVDLRRIPMIKCWPLDGEPESVGWPMSAEEAGTAGGLGRYITLGGMHTIDASDRDSKRPRSHNIGMYRAQLLGPTQLAMHWHVHHDGAAHWRSWKAIGEPMPIAICLGGEPVLPYAATAPLPPGISELLLAGFLEGSGIPMVQARTVPLRVPANSEIVIEGFVRTDAGACGWEPSSGEPLGDGAVLEGPFGDHTGYYSLPDRYPIVDVTAVTHRRDAVFPATVVGPPPQEDYWLGKSTERVFLPLLQTLIPELVDYNLPMSGCFHNWAVLGIRKAYPLQARRVMHGVWGAGQMAWTKCLVVVDADEVDVHDQESVLRTLFRNVDFSRDVERTFGPLDILDHAAAARGAGGKIGFDATSRWPGEEAGQSHCDAPKSEDESVVRECMGSLSGFASDFDVPQWGTGRCIVAQTASSTEDALARVNAAMPDWTGLLLLLDEDVEIRDRMKLWFHVLAGIDADRDISVAEGVMCIDARSTKISAAAEAAPPRPWPPFLGWSSV